MQNANLDALLKNLNSRVPDPAQPKMEKKAPAKRVQSSTAAKGKGKAPDGPPRPAPPSTAAALSAASANPQDINSAALGKRFKDVLDKLQGLNGTKLTPEQIKDTTGIDLMLSKNLDLLREMHRHPRITHKGAPPGPTMRNAPEPQGPAEWYTYFPEIPGITNKQGMLTYIRDNKGPAVQAAALKMCYLKAADDLQELKKEGHIFIIGPKEAGKETVFVRKMMDLEHIQDDVREHWFAVTSEQMTNRVPRDLQELQTAVVREGLRSALANMPTRRALQGVSKGRSKKPREKRVNIDKATNNHMPELFQTVQPKALDG